MRVLITRPEREAATLAAALVERGHTPVVAPLFELRLLAPPADFSSTLASAQAVLLTSANGARALAEATEQRGVKIYAVGDTTASTAEGLGFSRVTSASGDGAALAELIATQVDAKAGPLLHVAGNEVAVDFTETLGPRGYDVQRVVLYEAREAEALPDSARAALQARALDAIAFFSPRAASTFAKLVSDAGLTDALSATSAVAISPAAATPLEGLNFRQIVAAARPTRQAVLDEIDRLAAAPVQGLAEMSDTATPSPPPPPPEPVVVRRGGIGLAGAFVAGLVASVIVVGAAVATLPIWPADLRAMWQGAPPAPAPAPAAIDVAGIRRDAQTAATASVDAAKRELAQRLDDLDKRVRAAAATAAEARPAGAPDPAVAELRKRLDALEGQAPSAPATPAPAPAPAGDVEKDLAALRLEIATLRSGLQTLDQSTTQKLTAAAEKAAATTDQKALAAARASAVIGVAARLSAALESGLPFATDLGLLTPLAQGDPKLTEVIATLQPQAAAGVASRTALAASFPAVAKAALADDLADDSFGERVLGKLKGLISLRRVGADVAGDTVEAKLARAESALDAGNVAKAVELVKSLPPITSKATAAWLARAEAHLAGQRAVDQLAAQAVTLLGVAQAAAGK
jgi:uroporphyrinogen-III synthase